MSVKAETTPSDRKSAQVQSRLHENTVTQRPKYHKNNCYFLLCASIMTENIQQNFSQDLAMKGLSDFTDSRAASLVLKR